MNLKAVKFIKAKTPYKTGDIAGFTNDEAQDLIDEGVAVPYSKSKSVETETESMDAPVVDKMVKSPKKKK